jgi:hypothetical protein
MIQWLFIWRCAYGGIIMAVQGMHEMREAAETVLSEWTDSEIAIGSHDCKHDYECDCDTIAIELASQD